MQGQEREQAGRAAPTLWGSGWLVGKRGHDSSSRSQGACLKTPLQAMPSSSLEMVGWHRVSAVSSFHGLFLVLAGIGSVGKHGQEPSLKEAWPCSPVAQGTPGALGHDCLYTCLGVL